MLAAKSSTSKSPQVQERQERLTRIRITNRSLKIALGPYDTKSIKWDPQSFAIESPRLEQRLIDAEVQQRSLAAFMANPRRAMTYIVSGNPDDTQARYFAAFLAQVHMDALGLQANVLWETMIGAFDNPGLKAEPTMLVITNLTPRSSNLKYEKTRDLLEKHASIPKVLVVAGEDPISFAATRIHSPCHALAYFGSRISKTFNEVI